MSDDREPPEPESAEAEAMRRLRELSSDESAVETARKEAAALDDEFHRRLADLGEKAAKTKETRDRQRREAERIQTFDRETARGTGVGLQIAYMIIGFPMAGLALGWYLDNRLDANAWKPILVMGGAAAGIVLALVTLNRLERK